jgi:hypothetical protein
MAGLRRGQAYGGKGSKSSPIPIYIEQISEPRSENMCYIQILTRLHLSTGGLVKSEYIFSLYSCWRGGSVVGAAVILVVEVVLSWG